MSNDRRLYKISIISTHGTGKTTLCYEVAAELKKRGLKTKVFSEIAASAYEQGIPINETTTLPAQLYILLQHMCEEMKAAIRGYEVVVCDRSVYDNWIYLERRCGAEPNSFILDFLKYYAKRFPYDVVYKLPLVGELVADGIRDAESKAFQADIQRRLDSLLETLRIPHVALPEPKCPLRSEWCDTIVRDTLAALRPGHVEPKPAAAALN
jgi:nicotinamide riboside kinase